MNSLWKRKVRSRMRLRTLVRSKRKLRQRPKPQLRWQPLEKPWKRRRLIKKLSVLQCKLNWRRKWNVFELKLPPSKMTRLQKLPLKSVRLNFALKWNSSLSRKESRLLSAKRKDKSVSGVRKNLSSFVRPKTLPLSKNLRESCLLFARLT